jgi:hypothetical protein
MSDANPNPMEKSMVSVLVVANAGGGLPLLFGVLHSGRGSGERQAMGRGMEGQEMTITGGNKGGKREKHRRGREEERGEPGAAAPVHAGHLDKMTRG